MANSNLVDIFKSLDNKTLQEANVKRSDFFNIQARATRSRDANDSANISYSEENLKQFVDKFGNKVDKALLKMAMKDKRYTTLVDEAQQYNSDSIQDIKTQKNLRSWLSSSFPNLKERTINNMATSVFPVLVSAKEQEIEQIEEQTKRKVKEDFAVTPINLKRASNIAKDPKIIKPNRASKFISLSSNARLLQVNERFIARGRDVKGREFFYDFATGRRSKNPFQ